MVIAIVPLTSVTAATPTITNPGEHIALAKAAYERKIGPAKTTLNTEVDQLINRISSSSTVAALKKLKEEFIALGGKLVDPP